MSSSTVVIGAGLSGLTAAWTLASAGEEVVLLEASPRPGGVVRTERRDGFLLETGPNTVRPTPHLWRLIEALGLGGDVLLADPRAPRFVDFRGALHSLPMSASQFLGTRLLSAAGKLRLLTEPLRRRGTDPEESVAEFFGRRLGPEVADRIVEPFVGGIFAGSGARLSVSAAFPVLRRWEREHGSLLRGAFASRRAGPAGPPMPRGLVSFRDGLEALPRALAARLGSVLRPATSASGVAPEAGGWIVHASSGDIRAARVVLAAPALEAAKLVAGFAPSAARALEAIPHPPLAVLHLAWPETACPQPLRGFGHLVAPERGRRILGAVWSSSLFPGRAPAGQALVTVFLGGTRDPGALDLADDELHRIAAGDLRAQGLLRGDPQRVLLTRWGRAIPQYERGHEERISELERAEVRFPGLRFLGNYRGGISVSDVVRSGTEIIPPPGPPS